MQVVRIGLDLAKYVFEVHGVDGQGNVVIRKTLRRGSVSTFFANLPPCLVGMEASNGAHYWARVLTDFGHKVRLISPQFVAPYVKSNKNDRNDAEAICEAVGRPTMRFVPPKSPEDPSPPSDSPAPGAKPDEARQSDTWYPRRAWHCHCPRDIWKLRRALAEITGHVTDDLNTLVRVLIMEVQGELMELDRRIASDDQRIRELYRTSELCQRLGQIEGIGPVTATALVAAVADRSCFKNGRQFAAWLGLVPKQRSSGGRNRLFGISKRGDRYLRTLMIHGARAALGKAGGKQDPRSRWLGSLRQRRHPNVVAVALANKNARIAWAMLAGNVSYEPARSVQAA